MIIAKANAKENLGDFICLFIRKANAKTNLQIFICNHVCVGVARISLELHWNFTRILLDFNNSFKFSFPRGALWEGAL